MKTIIFLFYSLLFFGVSIDQNPSTAFDSLEKALASGDFKRIVSHIEDKLLLEINKPESVYSKAQAELILKDFFEKNKPKNFTIKSKSTVKGNYALIGNLSTEGGKTFRVSLTLRESGAKMFLDKLSITGK